MGIGMGMGIVIAKSASRPNSGRSGFPCGCLISGPAAFLR